MLTTAAGSTKRIVIALPCYNEAVTIAGVIADFRRVLPQARLIVCDNNSTDGTAEIARQAGAEVMPVRFQGKGNVVRRIFADIEADVYAMADGDGTYEAAALPKLIEPVLAGEVDMAIGVRRGADEAFPAGHRFGNWLFNVIVRRLFGRGLEDIFSGYRVCSRRFAKSFPAISERFETETEMSVFILEQRIPFVEIPTVYGTRPEGSHSKLSTYKDGLRILMTILGLFKHARPLVFFGLLAALLAVISFGLGLPVVWEWMDTGLVTRMPTAILASSIGLLAALLFAIGLTLDGMARTHRELRHLRYLNSN